MKQDVFSDPFGYPEWDTETSSRCFVHITNSMVWRAITGANPPTVPPTADEYRSMGIPWFDYYDDCLESLEGSEELAGLKSVLEMAAEKGEVPVADNDLAFDIQSYRLGTKRRLLAEVDVDHVRHRIIAFRIYRNRERQRGVARILSIPDCRPYFLGLLIRAFCVDAFGHKLEAVNDDLIYIEAGLAGPDAQRVFGIVVQV